MPRWPIRTPEERFWEKVNKGTCEECWEWTGSLWKGYGNFRVAIKTLLAAHIFSYCIHLELLDSGLSQRKIGELFGLSQTQIWKIKHGLRWSHISNVIKEPRNKS